MACCDSDEPGAGEEGQQGAGTGGGASSGRRKPKRRLPRFIPLSGTLTWLFIEGTIDRLIFACTMGLVAIGASAILWTVSMPWVAWRIFRWRFPTVRVFPRHDAPSLPPHRSAKRTEGGAFESGGEYVRPVADAPRSHAAPSSP